MWILRFELLQYADSSFYVVTLARHKMSAAKVYPFNLLEPRRKLVLNMLQCPFEDVAVVFAVAMNVETFDVGR